MRKKIKIAILLECIALIIGIMGWFFDGTPFIYNLAVGNGLIIFMIIIGYIYIELCKTMDTLDN